MDDEASILWQDVFDEIAAGRGGDLSCPFCQHRPLAVREEAGLTRVSCASCGRYVEARLEST